MKQSEEIKDLKSTINNLLTQNALLIAKTQLLESLLLEMVSQTNPQASSEIFTQYVNSLDERSSAYLQDLQHCYYEVEDPQFAYRQHIQNQQTIAQMKTDDRYKS